LDLLALYCFIAEQPRAQRETLEFWLSVVVEEKIMRICSDVERAV